MFLLRGSTKTTVARKKTLPFRKRKPRADLGGWSSAGIGVGGEKGCAQYRVISVH